MSYKLGSLFDGSGGFPLAGTLCGIEPVWAAEVEPYPIAVTRSRFPNMKHLGDISKINGAEIEPVDIITFGSPCQDLSVAGKRAGLKHEANGDEETTRSGLFMEAVRIIKEMREATNGEYPRYALWENVPGAFSSNRGDDFRIVLEELIRIAAPDASMPPVPKAGWNYADSYTGDGWSLAYRVFDAQYWGVPQRRRRIHLIADFRGTSAQEILFEREGLRGYFAEGRTPWQNTSTNAERSFGADDYTGERDGDGRGRQLDAVAVSVPYTLKIRSGCEGGGKGALIQEDMSATLATSNDQYLFQPVTDTHILDDQGGQQIAVRSDGVAPTLRAEMHGNIPAVMEPTPIHDQATRFSGKRGNRFDGKGNGLGVGSPGDPMYTLTQGDRNAVAYGVDHAITTGGSCTAQGSCVYENIQATLKASGVHAVAYGLDRASFNQGINAKFDFTISEEQQPTLTARGPGGVCYSIDEKCGNTYIWADQANTLAARDYKQPQGVAYAMQGFGDYKDSLQASGLKARDYKDATDLIVYHPNYIVRRLTPTECARLQGFADWWGVIEPRHTFTNEEYAFWCDVYLTKQIIDGKVEYDEDGNPRYVSSKRPFIHKPLKQMLAWHNKLWTDSAEYKMWGNGIALPPALYCMQGITDVLNREEEDSWML